MSPRAWRFLREGVTVVLAFITACALCYAAGDALSLLE
jgi:hypothetical protein